MKILKYSMARPGLLSGLLISLIAPPLWGQAGTSSPPADRTAGAPRSPSEAETRRFEELEKVVDRLTQAGSFSEAIDPARQAAEVLEKSLGPGHWRAADSRQKLRNIEHLSRLPKEGLDAVIVAYSLESRRRSAFASARYPEAERLDREDIAIREKWLANDRGRIGDAYVDLGLDVMGQGRFGESESILRRALTMIVEARGPGHPTVDLGRVSMSECLISQGKYAEAEPMLRTAYAGLIRAFGEEDRKINECRNVLSLVLNALGRFEESEAMNRKNLAIGLKTLGPSDPKLARTYNNLGIVLYQRGKYSEAESIYRKSLELSIAAQGPEHPETAGGYINLAAALNAQAKHAEAEPILRRAVSLQLRSLPTDHPYLYVGYANLAINLDAQGKFAEAEPMFRKALAIQLKTQGADHAETAVGFINLAENLDAQAKYAEAEPIFRDALASLTRSLGAENPNTISASAYLAANLGKQARYAEAEAGYRKVLEARLKALGADHPDVADAFDKCAVYLQALGRYAEAEPMLNRALDIRLKALGADHPNTIATRNHLAQNLDARGDLAEAARRWKEAADSSEAGQTIDGAIGLERFREPIASERLWLAVALARQGQPMQAWQAVESDLSRGLLDDLSARQLRPLTADERRRESDLLAQLQAVDEPLGKLGANPHRTAEEDKRLDELRQRKSDARGQFIAFENELSGRYRAFAGKPSSLDEIRRALPADAALVGWVDLDPAGPTTRDRSPYHWAWAIRTGGDPIWVPVPGTGERGSWTKEDEQRPGSLRKSLLENQPTWQGLASKVAQQRLGPLQPHLGGIKHIIVVPSNAMRGIPIEVLVEALPSGAGPMRVSYAPSGSMLARVSRAAASRADAPRLLALGDPAFPAAPPSSPPPPPDRGIAVIAVTPNGAADLAGLRAGDILQQYGDKPLNAVGDLKTVQADAGVKRIPVRFWRDGESRAIEVAAGPLGIRMDGNRTPAQVLLAHRDADTVLKPLTRGESLDRLPGTRREVEAIAGLFPPGRVTTLLGDQATEPAVQNLATTGQLKSYRFLHLATHGRADAAVAMNSALLLAPAPGGPTDSPAAGADGRITAQQIVNTWDLDAEMVVLSACETGLGRYSGGEGYLGFSQALFVKGARTVVLSLWEVNDDSTYFLMQRFYQNLLGRRDGLARPMPKADALDEAKRWLRGLSVQQVAELTRSKPRPQKPSTSTPPPAQRAFDHPHYWAGFILIGDPA